MTDVYTFGYAGHDASALHAVVTELDAVLLDIRWTPYSKQPGWTGNELAERFAMRYLHVPAFGNVEHASGTIRLSAPSEGIATVFDCLTVGPVVLMCACRQFDRCHRSHVAALLTDAGLTTQELTIGHSRRGRKAA
jgi:uncharacterized protein (DUF488 family)